jgi:hypothetical protein
MSRSSALRKYSSNIGPNASCTSGHSVFFISLIRALTVALRSMAGSPPRPASTFMVKACCGSPRCARTRSFSRARRHQPARGLPQVAVRVEHQHAFAGTHVGGDLIEEQGGLARPGGADDELVQGPVCLGDDHGAAVRGAPDHEIRCPGNLGRGLVDGRGPLEREERHGSEASHRLPEHEAARIDAAEVALRGRVGLGFHAERRMAQHALGRRTERSLGVHGQRQLHSDALVEEVRHHGIGRDRFGEVPQGLDLALRPPVADGVARCRQPAENRGVESHQAHAQAQDRVLQLGLQQLHRRAEPLGRKAHGRQDQVGLAALHGHRSELRLRSPGNGQRTACGAQDALRSELPRQGIAGRDGAQHEAGELPAHERLQQAPQVGRALGGGI